MATTVGQFDNFKRGLRTAGQVALGLLATNGLDSVWESYSNTRSIDPTIQVGTVLVLSGVAAWAMNMIEDKTGVGILVPKDREIGDEVTGHGIGAKAQ